MRPAVLEILDAEKHVHDLGKVLEITAELEDLRDGPFDHDGHFHVDGAPLCARPFDPAHQRRRHRASYYGRGRHLAPAFSLVAHTTLDGKRSARYTCAGSLRRAPSFSRAMGKSRRPRPTRKDSGSQPNTDPGTSSTLARSASVCAM